MAAKLILEQVKDADTEEIFVTGLLQNLGELVMPRTRIVHYDEVVQATHKEKQRRIDVEESILGVNHCFIAAEVAKKWAFPKGRFYQFNIITIQKNTPAKILKYK